MKIQKTLNKVAYENTYYIENDDHVLLVDPGSDWEIIKRKLKEINKPISAILLTHTHYDHIMSVDKVREAFGNPPVYVAEAEASWLYTPEMNLSGLDRHADLEDVVLKPADVFFEFHQEYLLDGFRFYVVPTPGHSIGGVSLVFPDGEFVVTGDALFKENIGRTDLPTGDLTVLLAGIERELFRLPSHYEVHPGHGGSTRIGHEKMFNPHFQRSI